MNAFELILFMIGDSEKSESELSRSVSRDRTYLRSIIKRHTIPKVTTFSKISDACGFDLLVRRRVDGYEIPIDDD